MKGYGWNHCYKKRVYETWDEAEREAKRTMEEAPDGKSLFPYLCHFFPHWHVGHDMPKARQRALARTKVRA